MLYPRLLGFPAVNETIKISYAEILIMLDNLDKPCLFQLAHTSEKGRLAHVAGILRMGKFKLSFSCGFKPHIPVNFECARWQFSHSVTTHLSVSHTGITLLNAIRSFWFPRCKWCWFSSRHNTSSLPLGTPPRAFQSFNSFLYCLGSFLAQRAVSKPPDKGKFADA